MMDRTTSTTFQAVEDWLRSLGLLHYAQKFYDNGYEDIDTCKLIKEEDLNAIDITIERDRQDILIAVIKLQQNIYFELEPDNNESIAEKTKIETIVLKTKLKECLEHDKVQLTEPPYYNRDGTVGDLYPLAIKYSSELATFFNDVIDALEQLRKRQLPEQNYNEMAMGPPTITRNQELRRSLRTTSNPADYLNCETPERAKKRSSSFSKFDTRVTKSTTDLTKDNIQQSDISPKGKSKKTKSRFGGVFKRGATTRQGNSGVSSEFIASEIKLSQNEIVGIMQKIKNKEISEEDALNEIKRGVTKSLSCDGNSVTPAHHPLVETNSIGYLLSKEAASAVKSKKSLKTSSSMKGRNPTAQFYTREDDMAQSSTSLLSNDSRSSLEISGDHSGNNMEDDRLSISSKNSPEIGKHGLFKKIRNSMRKKKGENGDVEKEIIVGNGSPDNSGNSDIFFNPSYPNSSEMLETLPPKSGSFSSPVNMIVPQTTTVPPPPSTTPPPPPIMDDSLILSQQTEDEFRERKPSLKIKSYPQNQDEVSKRRSLEKNKNSSKTENEDSVSSSDHGIYNPSNVNQSISHPNKIIPQIPPRPAPRKSSSDSNNPIPTVPPRRSRIFRAESTDRHMDEIVKEMNEIAANLEELNVEDATEKPKSEAASKPIEHSKKPPEVPSKTSTPGWKKPVPPPRPNVQKERLDDTSSLDSRSTSSLDSSKSREGIPCQMRKVNKRNIRSIVSPKQLISKKLRKEVINLATAPYTSRDGSWCLPYNLIIRYANELPYSSAEIIRYLDEIRIEDRERINLPVIPYAEKDLGENKSIRPNYSLNDWLIYIGLPMFIEDFREAGISRIEEIVELDASDIKYIGIFDDNHIKLLLNKAKTLLL